MKYMLLIYETEGHVPEEARAACMIESAGICDGLAARGQFLAASPLEPVATAATVRVRDGRPLVTDGPFAETTEQLGGFYLVDLPNLDEAIALASRLPPAARGTVEIRPLSALEGLPPSRPFPEGDASGSPFLLLCYDDEAAWKAAGPEAMRQAQAEAAALARELDEAGQYVAASPLHLAATATSVRVRDGKRVITDGPFAETREVLGGFYVVQAESRDAALRVAARHPGNRFGAVEVRPIFPLSRLRKTTGLS